MANVTYKSAGVDLELYDEAMRRLPSMMQRTFTPRVIPVADAFAGLMRLNHSSRPGAASYQDPVLVSGTDGVGTKLKVAQLVGKYDTVGIDLVAMSVNDVLCLGAEPLLFLDYLALGKDNPDLIGALVKGVSDGCVECGAALLGGETAIMPDIYHDGDFDMAGFCVGVAERTRLIDGKATLPSPDFEHPQVLPGESCHLRVGSHHRRRFKGQYRAIAAGRLSTAARPESGTGSSSVYLAAGPGENRAG